MVPEHMLLKERDCIVRDCIVEQPVEIALSTTQSHTSSTDHVGNEDAVWQAAFKGCVSTLRLALSRTDMSVNMVNVQGISLLAFVCIQGHTACAKFLIKRSALLDQREPLHGGTALHHAVSSGRTGCAQALVGARASLNALAQDGTTPLIMASLKNHAASVRLLLQSGADSERRMNGRTALEWAVAHHHVESADVIRGHQKRCGTSSHDRTTISVGIGPYLVGEMGEEDEDGPLCAAAAGGEHAVVLELLGRGSHPTSVDPRSGFPALLFAAAAGYMAIVALLIERGAPVDQRDRASGRTALMQACSFRNVCCVHLLIAAKAEVSLASWNGIGALHRACASGCVNCVELLLEAGVGPDGTKPDGPDGANTANTSARETPGSDACASPLQLACVHGHIECAKKLIHVGASLSFTSSGKTALELAREANHAGCIALLEEAAAWHADSVADMLCKTRKPRKPRKRRAKTQSAPHAPQTPPASLSALEHAPAACGIGVRGVTPVACALIVQCNRPDDSGVDDGGTAGCSGATAIQADNVSNVAANCDAVTRILSTRDDASSEGATAVSRPSVDPLSNVHEALLCPIKLEMMRDPVCTCDGHSYERASIEKWLLAHDTSPMTGEQLENKTLVPNIALCSQIRALQDVMPQGADDVHSCVKRASE